MLSLAVLSAGLVLPPTQGIVPGLAERTIVLTYHDMVPKRDSNALWFDCTPEELREQLDWLTRQGANFASTESLESHLVGRARLPRKSVVITFADNYRGFYTHAWPILKERKIPVTLFVHTGYVGSEQGRPKMTWAQLRELKASGLVTVASQTVTHPADLGKLKDAQVRKEMLDSRATLDRQLTQTTVYVAYPNGKFDSRSLREAKAVGYRMGFTEEQTPAEKSPGIFAVARYVHTKWRQAWKDAGNRAR